MKNLFYKLFSLKQESRTFVRLQIVTLSTILFFSSQIACRCHLRNGFARSSLLPSVQQSDSNSVEETPTELVLTTESRVERISLSANRKRMIVETRAPEETINDLSQSVGPLSVELWNVEFAEARPELFTERTPFLVSNISGSASFDEKGDRVFWLDQESNNCFAQSTFGTFENTIVRGAVADDETTPAFDYPASSETIGQETLRPLPLYLQWDDDDSAESAYDDLPTADFDLGATASDLVNMEIAGSETSSETIEDEVNNSTSDDIEVVNVDDKGPVSEASDTDVVAEEDNSGTSTEEDSTPEIDSENAESGDDDATASAIDETSDKPIVNVVMTKALDTESRLFQERDNTHSLHSETRHMKTALEAKNADQIWISPRSKWLVCHTADLHERNTDVNLKFSAAEAEKKEAEQEKKTEDSSKAEKDAPRKEKKVPDPYSLDWSLIPVRDRKRVVRFPETIKMTFDSATSDEDIKGRVVDVLAISDAEDLVATLVEEITDKPSVNPRYKIVVWDLNVARTVDLEKAIMPLRAIEVSQIAIPHPIAKKYCKFSPSGKSIAARLDPKYVSIWQSTNGRLIGELGEHTGLVEDFEFSPGETRMVVGIGGTKADVLIWEIRKGVVCKVLDNLPSNVKSIDAVAFSSNARFVYFATDLGEVRRWDVRTSAYSYN